MMICHTSITLALSPAFSLTCMKIWPEEKLCLNAEYLKIFTGDGLICNIITLSYSTGHMTGRMFHPSGDAGYYFIPLSSMSMMKTRTLRT